MRQRPARLVRAAQQPAKTVVTTVRSRDVMPWLMRRRLRAPAQLLTAEVTARGERSALMQACRHTLAQHGFSLMDLRRGWLGTAVPGDVATSLLERGEAHADRDDEWWR